MAAGLGLDTWLGLMVNSTPTERQETTVDDKGLPSSSSSPRLHCPEMKLKNLLSAEKEEKCV